VNVFIPFYLNKNKEKHSLARSFEELYLFVHQEVTLISHGIKNNYCNLSKSDRDFHFQGQGLFYLGGLFGKLGFCVNL